MLMFLMKNAITLKNKQDIDQSVFLLDFEMS